MRTALSTFLLAVGIHFLCLAPVLAQEETISLTFETDSIYTGRLQKKTEAFTFYYPFTALAPNTIIESVTADCACAMARIPTDTLVVGQKDSIGVAFDPYRPGPFYQKMVIKYNNGQKESIEKELILAGYVEIFTPDPTLEFPHSVGALRLANKQINLGTIDDQKLVRREVGIFNTADSAISFAKTQSLPAHIEVFFDEGSRIESKQRGKLIIYYDPAKKQAYGYHTDSLLIQINDQKNEALPLVVTTSIKKYSENSDNSARLSVEVDTVDIGRQSASSLPIMPFNIKNIGKDTLQLLKLEPNIGCEVLSVESKEILPYQSSNINLRLLDIGRKGKQNRQFAIFSNDAEVPIKTLVVLMDLY